MQLIEDTVPFDSHEARRDHHLAKLRALEAELQQYNLLEHPREILAICKQIIAMKEALGENAR